MSTSDSQTASTNQTTQNTTNEQLALQDFEGVGIADNSGEIMITDAGAITGSLNLAGHFSDVARDLAQDAFGLSNNVLDFSDNALESGYDLASNLSDQAFSLSRNSSENTYNFANNMVGDFKDLVGNVLGNSQSTLQNTVGALNAITRQRNMSKDERLQKLALYGFAALLAMFALMQLKGS